MKEAEPMVMNEEARRSVGTTKITERLSKSALIVSLSVNVFMFASLAMYGTWLASASLDDFWRGLVALGVWIGTFGGGALVFWKIVREVAQGALHA